MSDKENKSVNHKMRYRIFFSNSILIVVFGSLFFVSYIVFQYIDNLYFTNYVDLIVLPLFCIALFFVVLHFVFLFTIMRDVEISRLKTNKHKALKYNLKKVNFDVFYSICEDYFVQKNKCEKWFDSDEKFTVYSSIIKGIFNCFVFVCTDFFTKEILQNTENKVDSIISPKLLKVSAVNVTLCLIAKKTTPTFYSFVNHGVEQGWKNGRFIVGISTSGKKLYVAKPVNSIFIGKYKKLKKRFFELVNPILDCTPK